MSQETMKAVRYKGPQIVQVETTPVPVLSQGDVLIKVAYAGICGTDLNILSGKHPRARAPLTLGHEISGTIVDVEKSTKDDLQKGQKVAVMPYLSCGYCYACREGYPHVCSSLKVIGVDRDGGFAEYVAVPRDKVIPLGEDVSLRRGALVEPLAVGIHILHRSALQFGDTAVVLGCGPIGLFLAYVLGRSGVRRVYLSEVNEFRISMARDFGFEVVNSSQVNLEEFVNEKTAGRGADAVFEVAGVQETIGNIVPITRVHGKVMLVGAHKSPPQIDVRRAVFKELVFLTSRVSTNRDFRIAVEMLAEKGASLLEQIITQEFSLGCGSEAFALASNPGAEQLKILFKSGA